VDRLADTEIREMVKRSCRAYEFRRLTVKGKRRIKPGALIRLRGGKVERLRGGSWMAVTRTRTYENKELWEPCDEMVLRARVRRYALADLDAPTLGWHPREWRTRVELSLPWRWIVPPLGEGTARRPHPDLFKRAHAAYAWKVRKLTGDDLTTVTAQISDGYEHALGRIALFEQRATIFLGTSALTSSLIVGNASLLIGTSKLNDPYLELAAISLAVAGICAVFGAFRALQASMFTFVRSPPTSSGAVANRFDLRGDELARVYVGALFVSAARADVVANWKGEQLRGARRWVLMTTTGVVALTIIVLLDVLH
jgi:hypothetical protein